MFNLTGFDDLIAKGGWVIYALLPLSVYVMGIIIYKFLQLWAAMPNRRAIDDAIAELENDSNSAYSILNNQKGPVARVMEGAVKILYFEKYNKSAAKEEITRIAAEQLKPYDSHMKGLEMAYNLGPLLGLLGTVSGMVKTFASIQSAGSRVDPSLLAGGIWEALLTTVVGLAVATPALAAHYIFEMKIDKIKSHIKDGVARVLVASEKDEGGSKPSRKKQAA